MRQITRRDLLALGAGATAAPLLAACGVGNAGSGGPGSGEDPGDGEQGGGKPDKPEAELIGDGSTSYTGKQPHQPEAPKPLEPGEKPPQFVVFSWDGAGEVGNGLFTRFLDLAEQHDAHMTFFLSGLYLLPESKKRLYSPPNNPVGASDIGYLTDAHIKDTLAGVRRAWLDGHEIGTHFNGHFCGGSG
ncbi:lipoprotein, partial [Streptomyces sp. NRRL F-6602]